MNEIGIKLADGSFYPILSDEVQSQKLELTTVRDNQETVQIDLFRKTPSEMEYVGSLIVENISLKKAYESTIELNLSVDENENLRAEATDADSGAKQTLKVSLSEAGSDATLTGFNLSDSEQATEKTFEQTDSENIVTEKTQPEPQIDEKDAHEEKKKSKLPIFILVFLGIALLILAILLLTRSCENKDKTEIAKTETDSNTPNTTSKVPVPAKDELSKTDFDFYGDSEEKDDDESDTNTEESKESDMIASKETDDTDKMPEDKKTENTEIKTHSDSQDTGNTKNTEIAKTVETTKTTKRDSKNDKDSSEPAKKITDKSSELTQKSVRYKIKFGDTLWDLAESYYKDPWDFKIIADHNNIKNPSLIITGTYIEIPAK